MPFFNTCIINQLSKVTGKICTSIVHTMCSCIINKVVAITGLKMEIRIVLLVSLWMPLLTFAESSCHFSVWKDYHHTKLLLNESTSAYLFVTNHMAVDADGAPNAYHPEDNGLDFLANAGYPDKQWWRDVLVVDPNDPSRAYIQSSGEFAGYFVSKTALQDPSKSITDSARYVDARHIPYLVFPGSFYKMKGTGRLGDLGFAINLTSGEKSPFVVADIGPASAPLGEVSIALAEGLGGHDVNPKNSAGAPLGTTLYVVFPNSSRQYPWPQSIDAIAQHANSLLDTIGGEDSVLMCKDLAMK